MAYTVLARRYRSTTFDEVIGQEHIAQTLKRAIKSGRIAHAFLFCGTRGTGKTSTARILAKCLNCQSDDKPVETPCNKCNSCQAIARGEDMSVIEIDAASNTGVDNIREVIEGAYNSPAGRFKIYIIDEVHMLSKSAFNALLKTLEEPPAHVKFILATTEPEKVLPTILSRCQRYDFRNIPTREIAAHLADICKKEKIKAVDDALLLVAKAGAGSMRDSLSLLDRLLSLGEKDLTVEMIEQLLGLPRTQLLFDLADAIGRGDIGGTIQQADAMVSAGQSPDTLIASLIDHLRNLLILNTCGAESKLVDVPGLPIAELVGQSQKFDAMVLSQDIAILEELRRQMRVSQAGRALLDATLARLAMAEQFASVADLLSGDASAAPAQKKKPELTAMPADVAGAAASPMTPPTAERPSPLPPGEGEGEGLRSELPATAQPIPPRPVSAVATSSTPSITSATPPVGPHPNLLPEGEGTRADALSQTPSTDDEDDALPEVGKVFDGPKRSMFAAFKASTPKPAPTQGNIEPVTTTDPRWSALLQTLADKSPGVHGVISQGRLLAIEDGQAVIEVHAGLDTLIRGFEKNGKKQLVREAVGEAFGDGIGVRFKIAAPTGAPATPPIAAQRNGAADGANTNSHVAATSRTAPVAPMPTQTRATPEQLEAARNDPFVKQVLDTLGGTIVKVEPN